MADGFALAELIKMRADGGGGDGEILVEEGEKVRGLVLERMRPSRMPRTEESERVASARRLAGMASRSRTSMGAVLWLMPRRTRAGFECGLMGSGTCGLRRTGWPPRRRG
jgi:hypothetical protein